jgi:hypothetical protein
MGRARRELLGKLLGCLGGGGSRSSQAPNAATGIAV